MATNVPVKQTNYPLADLIAGLVYGWYLSFNELPKKESIGVLYAQNALETGGTVKMFNNNIGNVKYIPSADPSKDAHIEYMMLAGTWEIINGKKVVFQPPHKQTWFRSFNTLGEGVSHHLAFLRNNRYKNAWQAVVDGDPTAFSKLLKKAGYYTASEADYTRLMVHFFKKYMANK